MTDYKAKSGAALLARVSTQEQALNGHSIGEQIERMKAYCKAMGWTVYDEYIDAGYSGSNTDRPALQRIISDIHAGRIDKVLVYKLDRLSRSQKDTLELIEDVFLASGVDFVSISENFDTTTPFGRAMIGILAVFAQLEREQIKERMAMGRLARAKEGRYSGQDRIPIGYDYVDGMLVRNPYEASLVKQVFRLYIEGYSPKMIASRLNSEGRTHRYGSWSESTVRNVLRRRTYIGEIMYAGEWYPGRHEPIISQEVFEKAQKVRLLKHDQYCSRNIRPGKAGSYLAGFLVCAQCGARYGKNKSASRTKNGIRYYDKYTCYSRSKKTKHLIKDPSCKNKIWDMSELDGIIFGEIEMLAQNPEKIEQIQSTNDRNRRVKTLTLQISDLENRIGKLVDLYITADMPQFILDQKVSTMNERREKLRKELEQIEQPAEPKLSREEAAEIAEAFPEILLRQDFTEIRDALEKLIDHIELDNENVTIHWNFV